MANRHARRSPLAHDGGPSWLDLLRRLWRSTRAAIPAKQPIHNPHGHLIITVTGLDLTGAQEVERLRAVGCRTGDYARSCLLSTNADSYDQYHRLVAARAGMRWEQPLPSSLRFSTPVDGRTADRRKECLVFHS